MLLFDIFFHVCVNWQHRIALTVSLTIFKCRSRFFFQINMSKTASKKQSRDFVCFGSHIHWLLCIETCDVVFWAIVRFTHFENPLQSFLFDLVAFEDAFYSINNLTAHVFHFVTNMLMWRILHWWMMTFNWCVKLRSQPYFDRIEWDFGWTHILCYSTCIYKCPSNSSTCTDSAIWTKYLQLFSGWQDRLMSVFCIRW